MGNTNTNENTEEKCSNRGVELIEDLCYICVEKFDDDIASSDFTVCNQRLHTRCMKLWFSQNSVCPGCMKSVAECTRQTPTCGICQDVMSESQEDLRTTMCNHKFHFSCLTQWFGTKRKCPTCDRDIDYLRDEFEDCDGLRINVEEVCAYCREEFESGNRPTNRAACGHRFHMHCMNVFLPLEKSCRVCRTPILDWVDTNDICVVCYDIFYQREKKHVSHCNHEMHKECLEQWVKTSELCPICYTMITNVNSTDTECSICLENFGPDEKQTVRTICMHKYHVHCLQSWLLNDNFCPICRRILTRNNRPPTSES